MDSPISHILHTNRIPTDLETRQIKPIISQGEVDLCALDAQITQTQANLEDQLRQRAEVQKHLESHIALLSPARRLPADLITEIFLRCLPTDRYPGFCAKEAPLLLASVCHGWRELALSIPQLWSSFHISPTCTPPVWRRKGPILYRPQIKGVESWLSRSGGCPLSISLFSYGQNDGFECAMLTVLVQHAHRWKDVHLKMTTNMFQVLVKLTSEAVPLLEYISLDVVNRRWGDTAGWGSVDWEQITFLRSAPLLQRVVLFTMDGYKHVLPWSQLTHLSMTSSNFAQGLEPNHALETLRSCSQLRSCRLNIVAPTPSQPDPSASQHPVITMPLLGSLHLRSYDAAALALMLEHLDLPKLHDFGIDADLYAGGGWGLGPMTGGTIRPRWPHTHLVALLSRATTPLKRLSLHNNGLTEDELIECLKLAPDLVELSFRDSKVFLEPSAITERVLRLLTPTPPLTMTSESASTWTPSPVLNPELESIILRSQIAVPDAAIFDFVQSRWRPQFPGVAQLKSAVFQFERDNPIEEHRGGVGGDSWSDPEDEVEVDGGDENGKEEEELPDDWVALRDLKKEGLHLSVVYGAFDVLVGNQWFDPPRLRNDSWWLQQGVREWALG